MSTSTAASVAVFEYDREAIRVKARLISMTKGLAHNMFSRIFRIRMYDLFSNKYYVIFVMICSKLRKNAFFD